MHYDTIFYICGGVLAALAVTTSFIGLRSDKFPGRYGALVLLVFVAMVGVTTTYAVLNGQEEQEARAEELEAANEEVEGLEEEPVGEERAAEEGSAEGGAGGAATGPGGTVGLAASPTDLAYDKKSLSSKPGEVTIDFENPAAIEHDVAIEKDGKVLAKSETISEGDTSVTADLPPGTYTFLCTVPGHAEAGMEGTLTVK